MNILESIVAAGVVGAGGAGFPTQGKMGSKAEIFIVNAAECEPVIETDKFLCRTFAKEIVSTVALIANFLEAKRAVIALKGKYKTEISALTKAIKELGSSVEICQMPTFYPAGDEQTMVQFVTGKTAPERGIPLAVGAVVDNVGTVFNIYEALKGFPVCKKYLSVACDGRDPVMMYVPIGTSFRECIERAGIKKTNYAVINGGPMMGKVLVDEDAINSAVVTKTTGSIIVLPKDHYLVRRSSLTMQKIKHQAHSACIQCRFCTDLCPRYQIGHMIHPHLIMRNLWRENQVKSDEELLSLFGEAMNCCECGACELYSCPMGLSPRKVNAYFRQKFREKKLSYERYMTPQARPTINQRRIPTERLCARLGIADLAKRHVHGDVIEYTPREVFIPTSQHIGKPAEPIVKVGDMVKVGDLVAKAAEGLSANISTGFAGKVTEVSAKGVRITAGGEA